jgi:putative methyltransferase
VAENEAVVSAALAQHNAGATGPAQRARLVPALPTWRRRGVAGGAGGLTPEEAACVVRALPEDGTTGFFVAIFEKGRC